MNKKAFTLVELMGIITVLGLISLLVAPTIINQIRNSKGKIDNVTEKLIYSATDLYLDNKQSEYPKNDGSTYCIKLQDLVNDGKLSSPVLDSSGNEISLDRIIAVDVYNANYTYRMSDTCESKKTYRNDIMISENSCIVDEKCSDDEIKSGVLVNVKVNETENYDFYVISDTETELTLIMNQNLGDNVKWHDTATVSYGPLTVVTALKERTSTWTNIEEREYTYSDDGGGNTYTEFIEIMRARMLTYREATTLGCAGTSGSCPRWLYENLYTHR